MYNEIIKNTKEIYNNSDKSIIYIETCERIYKIHKEIGDILNKFKTIYKTRRFYENEDYLSVRYANRINVLKEQLEIEYRFLKSYDYLNESTTLKRVYEIMNNNVDSKNKFIDNIRLACIELFEDKNIIELSRLLSLISNIVISYDDLENNKKYELIYEEKDVLDIDENEEKITDPSLIKINLSLNMTEYEKNEKIKEILKEIINNYNNKIETKNKKVVSFN